jgi:CheY-like chemotaxis protein
MFGPSLDFSAGMPLGTPTEKSKFHSGALPRTDDIPSPITITPVKLPNFRTALVIADDCGLRKSVVQHLKHEGWIVHGITNAEHALPILACIPYGLIIVDYELPGIDGKDFVRLLHNAKEWRAIHLVALTNCISAPLATELAAWGAFPARKEAWLDDLSHFLITLP